METRVDTLKGLLAVSLTLLVEDWSSVASAFIGACDDGECGADDEEDALAVAAALDGRAAPDGAPSRRT